MVGRNLLRELAMAAGHYQGSRRAEFEVGTYLENRCRRSAGRMVAKKKMISLGIEPWTANSPDPSAEQTRCCYHSTTTTDCEEGTCLAI